MFLLSNSAIQIDMLDKYDIDALSLSLSLARSPVSRFSLERSLVRECRHGETALHCACKAGNRDVVKLLLDYNADCSISGINGTPQEIAERVGDSDILQLITDCLSSKNGERRITSIPAKRTPPTYPPPTLPSLHANLTDLALSAGLQSLTFDPRVLELAEAQGYDTSVAIACLYQLQKRGAPTDNLDLLIQEINKQSHHHQRECSICLCKEIDSLLLPCRYVPLPVCARAHMRPMHSLIVSRTHANPQALGNVYRLRRASEGADWLLSHLPRQDRRHPQDLPLVVVVGGGMTPPLCLPTIFPSPRRSRRSRRSRFRCVSSTVCVSFLSIRFGFSFLVLLA